MLINYPTTRGQPKDGKVSTFSDIVEFFLETYESDNIIEKAELDIRNLFKSSRMTRVAYEGMMSRQVFRCRNVYYETRILEINIKGLL